MVEEMSEKNDKQWGKAGEEVAHRYGMVFTPQREEGEDTEKSGVGEPGSGRSLR